MSQASGAPVTVRYSVVEHPSLSYAEDSGEDFLAETGSVTIPAGQTEGTIQVTIYGDTKYEADEVVRVELTGATGAVVDPDPVNYRETVEILNDDPAPSAAVIAASTETASPAANIASRARFETRMTDAEVFL